MTTFDANSFANEGTKSKKHEKLVHTKGVVCSFLISLFIENIWRFFLFLETVHPLYQKAKFASLKFCHFYKCTIFFSKIQIIFFTSTQFVCNICLK